MDNDNLSAAAFPLLDKNENGVSVNVGLSKHEYATILLVAGHLANPALALTKESGMHVINKCSEMAAEILNRFNQ